MRRSGTGSLPGNAGGARAEGRPNLVKCVSDDLRRMIIDGELSPGDKLPSEAGLTAQYDVSRTVIREAIATLRADGLLEARHGVGVFVGRNRPSAGGFIQEVDCKRVSSVIEVLELRAAVEIEAAALAAIRCSPAQEETIWDRFRQIAELIVDGQKTAAADFDFHLAVAAAANNPKFGECLELMGRNVIPRTALGEREQEKSPPPYLEQIQSEHRRIAEAISSHDPDRAREEMRTHLNGSLGRYREMVRRG
jgi:GntR family transcriptional regulator, transcriptional repressor for pyruvate dehydrogenase complex